MTTAASFDAWLSQAEADLVALARRQAEFRRKVDARTAAGRDFEQRHVVREDDSRPQDRLDAADLLSRAICGDSLGVTTAVLSAFRAGRLTFVVEQLAAVVVDATPDLRRTEIADRLRREALGPPRKVKPVPSIRA
ncbi:hypothetical protein [Mycolicibacterium fluoranthenivorans]|uniref:hypothetical protein n=1 Tax=Mycolicibacterium fluoranthenivorans TaxID=258505 RepID=UPI0011142AFB|nr:hypothetical protein [Mycolicibacterium fluoranthenivorans]